LENRNKSAIYILSNRYNNVLYVGVTHNLYKRILQHKQKTFKGYTYKYNIDKLVYFEFYNDIRDAIVREKQLKAGSRQKKLDLIISFNPNWRDLSQDIS
jgi:putative endonuclease